MKNLVITSFMFFMLSSYAHIEHVEDKNAEPTPQELSANRACFEELAKQGCGDPGDNIKEFRGCLHDAYPSLTDDCQKMMTNLYSRRK